ncbi:uncharacterized protein LAESUDRAFT_725441 [Laetiporus sulphureus 93-53]|uniref:RING-type domain-containing protein n=1 Tax=Laetiporus sulphureus 93-53 TaxID=1314785 RepID=A0A165EHU9_9APHY|nr:uncharacterized protein LAESUDRAFT_725441 [Laetiporus sulphureus 93-53]KZT07079.1 hypothetical protein LAESUDRAFT_725441 [Laetiporus sulphureus 93-53]
MSTGGLPLLSGPPPEYSGSEQSCRKCDKEFNVVFTRSRKCNHCGYLYCHSCTDFQALMPRRSSEPGFDVASVCGFCIDNLTITAGGKSYLRKLPLPKLKKYAGDYNIKVNGVLEKDDLIDAIIAARSPTGCLFRENETFYRKHSVPSRRSRRPRGIFARAMDAMGSDRSSPRSPPQAQQRPYQPRQRTTSVPNSFPRPDLDPRRQQQRQPPQQQYQQPPTYQGAGPGPAPPRTPPTRPSATSANVNAPATGRTRASSVSSTPRGASPPPPTLDELLAMPDAELAHLSISTLKAVLFQNHVNARLVVEKEELVSKVRTLLVEERRERERHAHDLEVERLAEEERRREMEEETRMEVDSVGPEPAPASSTGVTRQPDHEAQDEVMSPPSPPPKPPASSPPTPGLSAHAQAMASRLERTGLCVICQDEDANIAIVDCGHLCLCRPCSELIMNSTRECPLCRTRIITEQRLLRIFKT